jgi:hypothetical protein
MPATSDILRSPRKRDIMVLSYLLAPFNGDLQFTVFSFDEIFDETLAKRHHTAPKRARKASDSHQLHQPTQYALQNA